MTSPGVCDDMRETAQMKPACGFLLPGLVLLAAMITAPITTPTAADNATATVNRQPDQREANPTLPESEYALLLHRPNILVADMERALRVYRDILGFEVNFLLDSMGVAYEIFGLDPQTKLRMAFVGEGRGAFGSLALTEAKGLKLPAKSMPYRAAIIIELAEGRLEGVVEQLKAEGLSVGTPYELDQPPRTDISFTDHDGHRVVLFEVHSRDKG